MLTLATTRADADRSHRSSFARRSMFLLVLLLLASLLFFWRLADRGLWSSHEARAAMNAQSLLEAGEWPVPRLNDGLAELQKPPLYYWLVAALAWTRGGEVDALAVRLPAAFAAVGCIVTLLLLGHAAGRPRAGFLAGLILASAAHFTWLARVGRVDMPLTAAIALALSAAYAATRHAGGRRIALLLIAYLALAAALLLKGPIGLALPAAAIGLFWILERFAARQSPGDLECMCLRSLGLWWGVPLVLMICVPVFVLINSRTDGEFFRVFFWHHNFERGFGGSRLRGHPWWFYGPQFAADFLPWSPVLVVALAWAWRRGGWRGDALARFGLAWFAAMAILLSCARFKRADYLLPAFPGAALFLGCLIERALDAARSPRGRTALHAGVAVLVLAMAGGWIWNVEYLLPRDEAGRDYRAFAHAMRRESPAPRPAVFFRTESHLLAFHAGRPLRILTDWSQLQDHLAEGADTIVLPASCLAEAVDRLPEFQFEEVARHRHEAGPRHERPLVLVRALRAGWTSRPARDAVTARR